MKDSINNYSKGLFNVAKENNQINEVLYDYLVFCESLNDDYIKFFTNKIIASSNKKNVIDELKLHKNVDSLLKNMIDDNQFNLVLDVLKKFENLVLDNYNIIIVNVTSAMKLDDAMLDFVIKNLEEQLNKFVVINNIINIDVIGGVMLEYKNYSLDNTVKYQIEQIKENIRKEVL